MSYESHAETARKFAKQYCQMGAHTAAAREYAIARMYYDVAGDWYMAAHCEGAYKAELRQIRPSAPVNISAIVD